MVVNYEFLDKEPMDNLITCLNFKVDKVVYEARVISCLPKWEQVFYEDVKDVELMDVLSYSCLDPIRKLERKAKDL